MSSLFIGTDSHRKSFQCYFYFIKINSKLLNDLFSRSELKMAIISQACSTSCCAELPRALQDISRQAAPSISQTFTGCPARRTAGPAAGSREIYWVPQRDGRPCAAPKGQCRGGRGLPCAHAGTRGLRPVPSGSSKHQLYVQIYCCRCVSNTCRESKPHDAGRRHRWGWERLGQTNPPSPFPTELLLRHKPSTPWGESKGWRDPWRDGWTCSPGQVRCFCFCLPACHPL